MLGGNRIDGASSCFLAEGKAHEVGHKSWPEDHKKWQEDRRNWLEDHKNWAEDRKN